MGDLGKHVGKIDQDYTTTHASIRVLTDTFRKAVAGGDSAEMTFAHLARWLMGERNHAEVCVLLAGAVSLLAAYLPGEVKCTCPAIQGPDGKHRAYCAKVLAVGDLVERLGSHLCTVGDDQVADHPAPTVTAVDATTGEQVPLPPALDEVRAQVVDARADLPAAFDGRRCVAPPVGCGKPLVSVILGDPRPDQPPYFRDQESAREYGISGWCQACQDRMFAAPDEDDSEDG